MERKSYEILEDYYKNLHDNVLRSEKRLINNSVLFTLIKITSNKTSKLLNSSSIKGILFPLDFVKKLEKDGYIRISDDKNKLDEYILTAQGIYEVERNKKNLDIKKIMCFLQDKYFSFTDVYKPLSDTEKVILLSMIGARTFSIDSPMDLRKQIVQDHWLEIFKKAYEFLHNHKVIKKDSLSFEKQGYESPVSYAMRRANHLPRKTQHIFISLSNSKYYLDIAEKEELSKSRLKRLFEQIFERVDEVDFLKEIFKFCNDIAYEKSKYVKEDFMFIESKYNEVIKDVLKQIYLG